MRKGILFLVWLLTAGCSQGFDRGRIEREFAAGPLEITDPSIEKSLALKPQLRFPFTMAIALANPQQAANFRQQGARAWRWTAKDKKMLEDWGADLRSAGLVKSAFVMSDMFIEGAGIDNYRRAAAKHGADAVLVVHGAADVDRYVNPFSIFYLTLVGTLFVPGSHKDALFVAQGALIDVGNGYLYASVEAEAENSTIRPAFFSSDTEAVEPAKKTVIEEFTADMRERMRNLR